MLGFSYRGIIFEAILIEPLFGYKSGSHKIYWPISATDHFLAVSTFIGDTGQFLKMAHT
jgi:hypothetical protein